jgi:hypothetical protein
MSTILISFWTLSSTAIDAVEHSVGMLKIVMRNAIEREEESSSLDEGSQDEEFQGLNFQGVRSPGAPIFFFTVASIGRSWSGFGLLG